MLYRAYISNEVCTSNKAHKNLIISSISTIIRKVIMQVFVINLKKTVIPQKISSSLSEFSFWSYFKIGYSRHKNEVCS